MAVKYREQYVPASLVMQATNLGSDDFAKLGIPITDEGIELLNLVKSLGNYWRKIKKYVSTLDGDDEENMIQHQVALTGEKVLEYRIKNQAKLLLLLPKKDAKVRMLQFNRAIREMLQSFLKDLSVSIEGDSRRNLQELTKMANNIFLRIIQNHGDILSWAQDGSVDLLATRILDAKVAKDSKSIDEELEREFALEELLSEDDTFEDSELIASLSSPDTGEDGEEIDWDEEEE